MQVPSWKKGRINHLLTLQSEALAAACCLIAPQRPRPGNQKKTGIQLLAGKMITISVWLKKLEGTVADKAEVACGQLSQYA